MKIRKLFSFSLALSLCIGLLLPASAAQEGIPIRVTRPDARIGSFEVWAEECDEGGNPPGGARYESSSTPAPGGTMDYYISVPFPTHRQDYLVHVKSVPDERYKGFFTGSERTMIWTYHFVTGLTLDPASLYLQNSLSYTIVPVFEPAGASAALIWRSSDEAVATVDQSGTVTALSEGRAIITASVENTGVSARCEVAVTYYDPPTEEATCGHTGGFHGGSGTATDPYRIYTTAELLHIASHNSGACFKQMLDLDFQNAVIDSVGSLTNCTYDGGYHILKNLKLEGEAVNWWGIFSKIDGSTIQCLGVENAKLAGDPYAAVLVGLLKTGTLRECYSLDCSIDTSTVSGGLVGQIMDKSTVERCYSLGANIRGSGSSAVHAGGLIGVMASASSTVADCYSIPYSVNANGDETVRCGALVGGGTSKFSFAKQNYFYPFGGLPGYGGGSIPTGLDLLIPLSPMSEFSNPDNFAFSSDDWVWRTVKFKGAEEGLRVPTLKGFAHQG